MSKFDSELARSHAKTLSNYQNVQDYLQLREQVLSHEFSLLQTLGFDLTIDHPYKHLLVVIKYLKGIQNMIGEENANVATIEKNQKTKFLSLIKL